MRKETLLERYIYPPCLSSPCFIRYVQTHSSLMGYSRLTQVREPGRREAEPPGGRHDCSLQLSVVVQRVAGRHRERDPGAAGQQLEVLENKSPGSRGFQGFVKHLPSKEGHFTLYASARFTGSRLQGLRKSGVPHASVNLNGRLT